MHPSPAPPVTKDAHLEKMGPDAENTCFKFDERKDIFEGNGMTGRLSKDNVVYIMKTIHAYYHS